MGSNNQEQPAALDDSFASPTKYPWRVSVVHHAIVNFFFYEDESAAREAYTAVNTALQACLDYKNDAPRGIVVGDAVGESLLSLIGVTNVRLVNERALQADGAAVERAALRFVGGAKPSTTDGDAVPGTPT